jgi:cation transport regulator ChaC
MAYVFAYGSLLSPASLRGTLPDVQLEACVPARCAGFTRAFDVAFPNDGSQPDKAYFDQRGRRPPFVLFADLAEEEDVVVNGVCVPVSDTDLHQLRDRELRYRLCNVSESVVDYAGSGLRAEVLTFLGRPEFRTGDHVTDAVAPHSYVSTMVSGAAFWDRRAPGFHEDFLASTRAAPVAPLTRVDYPGP